MRASEDTSAWLLLVHQMPAKPAYLRVKVWRKLQSIGAIALKGSVYALPASDETQEDFQWLIKEIVADGGEAMLCSARLLDGLGDDEARALFIAPRDADYLALADEAKKIRDVLPDDLPAQDDQVGEARAQLGRFRKRLEQIGRIDFFGAKGRARAEAALVDLEARLTPRPQPAASAPASDYAGCTWVTRVGVQVDRIACAWLIQHFIDPAARFKFVASSGYAPQPGELRFDMFEAEFTHEGDKCSFEVLLERMGIGDPALHAIAEIIHDIDLKDRKFGREETAGVAHLLQGVAAAGRGDLDRIARGGAMLDDLRSYFQQTASAGVAD